MQILAERPPEVTPRLGPAVEGRSFLFADEPTPLLVRFRAMFLESIARPGCPPHEREALASMIAEADGELAARLAGFVEDDQAAPCGGAALVELAEGYGIVRGAATPPLPSAPRRHANVCPDLGLRPIRGGGGRGRR